MPSLEDRVHVLKLGATGYSQIDAGIGVLTFQFTEIAAKGSGSNVSLLIGNPTNAAITDMTIWASWGQLIADGTPAYRSKVRRVGTACVSTCRYRGKQNT